jgi:hypothetical protein
LDALTPIIELQYQDETSSKAALQVKVPIGTTYSAADAAATALASVVASITGCVLVRQRIIYKAVQSPKLMAATGSSIKRQGVFIFEHNEDGNQELIGIPGILDSVLATEEPGAGVLIDLTNTDVIAFISAYIGLNWCNPFGISQETLVTAYRQSRV